MRGFVRRGLTRVLTASLAVWLLPPAGMGAPLAYPPAERGPVVEVHFGVRVADPYRWMEDLDAPATRNWVAAEKALTDAYLQKLPGREAIARSLRELSNYQRLGIPTVAGGRYFYRSNTGLQDQSVLYMSRDLRHKPTVVLDPATLMSSSGVAAIVGYIVSRDGRLLAYGVSESGSDWTEWHVRDVRTGRDLPDVLHHIKYYSPVFTPDGRGLYYSAFPAPPPGQELAAQDSGHALYYHRLGTPADTDRPLLIDPAHPDWQFEPHLGGDSRWLVISVGQGEVGDTGRESVYLLDLAHRSSTPIPLIQGFDASYVYIGFEHGRLYFLTTLDAPRGRIVSIDPEAPGRTHWRTIVPESEDTIPVTEEAVTLVDHHLIVRTLHDAHSRVLTYDRDGTLQHEVALPGPGTASGFTAIPGEHQTFYAFTDLITPPRIFRYDVRTGASHLWRAPQQAFHPGDYEEHQVFYKSRDGARIPLLLAHRRGLKLDGRNPVLLYGYGGFGIPVLPTFNPFRLGWMQLGGVFAVANIRGGGEYGDAWHRQGIGVNKQVVFDDFIAAAEWLIAQGYTSRPKLAILGGSNGGLLIGACLTQRPDLYGAAVAQVGVLDMLRFDRFGQGAGWTGDYGSPENPEDFKALLKYSPVHNVRPTAYPPTLVITGDHDTRVFPMHSFKFAAALQAAQSGTAPILLDVESASGHGGGPALTQAINQTADIYAFLVQSLGMSVPEEGEGVAAGR